MVDEPKRAVAERLLVEGYAGGSVQALLDLASPGFVDHALPEGFPPSLEGTMDFIRAVREAMPDLRYSIEDAFSAANRLAVRVVGRGTMRGPLLGHGATGREAAWPEIHVWALDPGKLVEHWSVMDWLGMFKQLGLTPGVRSIEIWKTSCRQGIREVGHTYA